MLTAIRSRILAKSRGKFPGSAVARCLFSFLREIGPILLLASLSQKFGSFLTLVVTFEAEPVSMQGIVKISENSGVDAFEVCNCSAVFHSGRSSSP